MFYIDTKQCYCEFGQVNEHEEIHGIARLVSENGVIKEGQFQMGMHHGWLREIYNTNFMLYSFEFNNPHGYLKFVNVRSDKVT
jgi:endo-beta-N-acetylglucosaminidase D